MKNKMSKEILKAILNYNGLGIQLTYSDAKDTLLKIDDEREGSEFYIEVDGYEFRCISSNAIWDIYVEAIQNLVEECYDCKIPDFVAIDWVETAKNCSYDGYGNTFSSYDGYEEETMSIDGEYWYIFRVN